MHCWLTVVAVPVVDIAFCCAYCVDAVLGVAFAQMTFCWSASLRLLAVAFVGGCCSGSVLLRNYLVVLVLAEDLVWQLEYWLLD